jgi:hypothetical protein
MKYYIFLAFFILSTFGNNAFSQDETTPSPEVVKESNPNNGDGIDIIVSDKNSIDLSGVHGPYSFMSLPKDVRDKLIRGLDEDGNETAAQSLRRTSEQAGDVASAKPRLVMTSDSGNLGNSALQLVRRVRGEADGWSVRIRNKTHESVDGQKIKSREYWIWYKSKF